MIKGGAVKWWEMIKNEKENGWGGGVVMEKIENEINENLNPFCNGSIALDLFFEVSLG